MNIPSTIIMSLYAEKNKFETELVGYKDELTKLDVEKQATVAKIRSNAASEIAEIDGLYEEMTVVLRSNMRQTSLDITKIDRAVSALGTNTTIISKPKSEKITTEMVYDAVIMHLFQNADGVSLADLATMLDNKKYIDRNKNRINVMSAIVGNMQRAGLIDKKNNFYVLADKQEALQRIKLRKFILSALRDNASTATEIENKVLSSGILETTEKRQIRGMLLGLSQGRYVTREVVDNLEYFKSA